METKDGNESKERDEIFSKNIRVGKRTYFFDVKSTKAGDYYLTITESMKRFNEDETFRYEKHRIFLYKEDFEKFTKSLDEVISFIVAEKGIEPIRGHKENSSEKPNISQ